MKIYDFSYYVKRREERRAAQAVAESVAVLHQPGAVIQLKKNVTAWFVTHQNVVKLRA